ncbi:MAG TPA: thrombospondin type 3 repeat-containing protein [Kiritimatiellia bacterium]|nr:thrombospondin type 3 repeat-containing protein [Kiritimatiellia bacterium]HMP35323.1 thrombospondin type 3 repeat-containing protein [Kiritimatiellia bacterium]
MLLAYALVAMAPEAAAPPTVSLAIASDGPILDEWGMRLAGTDPEADTLGLAVVAGDVVQVFSTADGIAYPPAMDGTPDDRTVLVKTWAVGRGAAMDDATSGRFGLVLTPRPAGGTRLFVRVFNEASVEQASFYADSQVFTVSTVSNQPFLATFSAMAPLDTGDADADGLMNAWEQSMGTDPHRADSDGDGLTDAEEMLAGTDPRNAASVLEASGLQTLSADHLVLQWPTVTGRTYIVEHWLDGDGTGYRPVAVLAGNGTMREIVLPGTAATFAHIRIRVEPTGAAE